MRKRCNRAKPSAGTLTEAAGAEVAAWDPDAVFSIVDETWGHRHFLQQFGQDTWKVADGPAAVSDGPWQLGWLVGEWRLQRRVADRRLREYGRVIGLLTVERHGDSLAWRERGTFTIAGRSHDVSRTYLLVDGWVFFDDGRPFHPWLPGEWVDHLCGADTYRGLVDVEPDTIRTLWDVSGPTKDQRLVTRLTRVWQSREP